MREQKSNNINYFNLKSDLTNIPYKELSHLTLLGEIISQEAFSWLKLVKVEEFVKNSQVLPLLIKSVFRNNSCECLLRMRSSEFFSNRFGVVKDPDIIKRVVGSIPPMNEAISMVDRDLEKVSLDNGHEFFMDTLHTEVPLQVKRIGKIVVWHRCLSEKLMMDRLLALVEAVLPYFIVNETVDMGVAPSASYKSKIVSAYIGQDLGYYLEDLTRPWYYHFLTDAYNNLLRMGNIGLSLPISEREDILRESIAGFKSNFFNCFKNGRYRPFLTTYEKDRYNEYFKTMVRRFDCFSSYITSGAKTFPFGIDAYNVYDQDFKECNKLKVSWEYIDRVIKGFYNQSGILRHLEFIHPDVKLGLANFKIHLQLSGLETIYTKNSPLDRLFRIFFSPIFRLKPILIKSILKHGADDLMLKCKEDGLLLNQQLETLFGYRNSHLILEEIKTDYLKWTEGDQDKFSDIQAEFIHKWAPEFFRWTRDHVSLSEKFRYNVSKFKNLDSMCGNIFTWARSPGACDDIVKQTNKGRKGISKTLYFSLFEHPSRFMKQRKKPRRNKVIIKREEFIKQRIVINSTLNTFFPLARINKFVSVATKGSGIMHFSNTKQQKSDMFFRIQKYLLYNKYFGPKYLCLPLDYSSYDHTITLGFIEASIEELAKEVGWSEEIGKELADFKRFLYNEPIYFKEIDIPTDNVFYKFGMLSGWKITSSVESLGNAIISYGVSRELGYKQEELLTMGDDLVHIVSNEPNPKRAIINYSNFYSKLGFKMNADKNSAGFYFCEFLRNCYYPGVGVGYPARVIASLMTLKPGREEQTFGAPEFQSVLKKVCKRYGCQSSYFWLTDKIAVGYNRPDIRRFMGKYVRQPYQFKLIRRTKKDYKFKVKASNTPIYKEYISILGKNYQDIIEKYVDKELITVKQTYSQIIEAPNPKSLNRQEIAYCKDLVNGFAEVQSLIPQPKLIRLGDYHLNQVCVKCLTKMKHEIGLAKDFMLAVNRRVRIKQYINNRQYTENYLLINNSIRVRDIIELMNEKKVLLDDQFIPASIMSVYRRNFTSYLNYLVTYKHLDREHLLFARSILRKRDNICLKYCLAMLLGETTIRKFPGYMIFSSQYD